MNEGYDEMIGFADGAAERSRTDFMFINIDLFSARHSGGNALTE